MTSAVFIGIDWGTSAARALAFDARGQVLAQSPASAGERMGVQRLHEDLGRTPAPADFAVALETLLASLGVALPQALPVLACGMIGSRQGLADAGYLACPAAPLALARRLVPIACGRRLLHLVPGLRMDGAAPDVMRGEETQLLGAMQPAEPGQGLMILPGSHSKWALCADGEIKHFQTQFSGELFAALSQHSLIGRLFTAAGLASLDEAAFDQGVALAASAPAQWQRHLFRVRALTLSGGLSEDAAPSFLSGLLIGHEIAAGRPQFPDLTRADLIGSDLLCHRYASALPAFGLLPRVRGNTAADGLWQLARAAGLVPELS